MNLIGTFLTDLTMIHSAYQDKTQVRVWYPIGYLQIYSLITHTQIGLSLCSLGLVISYHMTAHNSLMGPSLQKPVW